MKKQELKSFSETKAAMQHGKIFPCKLEVLQSDKYVLAGNCILIMKYYYSEEWAHLEYYKQHFGGDFWSRCILLGY